ncbi:MAG: hypothetical protein AB7S36_10850, partial [Planctomycetota bacterium]
MQHPMACVTAAVALAFTVLTGCKGPSLAERDEDLLVSSAHRRQPTNVADPLPDPAVERPTAPTPPPTGDDGSGGPANPPPDTSGTTSPSPTDPATPTAAPDGVRPIPSSTHRRYVLVDENKIFATVNGDVISVKDVSKDIEARLAYWAAVNEAMYPP